MQREHLSLVLWEDRVLPMARDTLRFVAVSSLSNLATIFARLFSGKGYGESRSITCPATTCSWFLGRHKGLWTIYLPEEELKVLCLWRQGKTQRRLFLDNAEAPAFKQRNYLFQRFAPQLLLWYSDVKNGSAQTLLAYWGVGEFVVECLLNDLWSKRNLSTLKHA